MCAEYELLPLFRAYFECVCVNVSWNQKSLSLVVKKLKNTFIET